jgi:hypothetical protein
MLDPCPLVQEKSSAGMVAIPPVLFRKSLQAACMLHGKACSGRIRENGNVENFRFI